MITSTYFPVLTKEHLFCLRYFCNIVFQSSVQFSFSFFKINNIVYWKIFSRKYRLDSDFVIRFSVAKNFITCLQLPETYTSKSYKRIGKSNVESMSLELSCLVWSRKCSRCVLVTKFFQCFAFKIRSNIKKKLREEEPVREEERVKEWFINTKLIWITESSVHFS